MTTQVSRPLGTTAPAPRRVDIDAEFARITDELTRRGFLAGGLGSAALLGVAGCSGGGTAATSATSRKVGSTKGTITVPASPKRVVSVNQADTVVLFDLGITPVGIFDYGVDYTPPRYREKYTSVSKIGSTGLDIEKIAALDPDLILGYDIAFNTDAYTKLTSLAPTVITSRASWKTSAQQVADAVGRADAFTSEQERYTARCAAIRARYRSLLASTRWDVVQGGFNDSAFSLYGPSSAPVMSVLADAGVRLAPASAAVRTSTFEVHSYERIDDLANAGAIAYWSGYGTDAPVNKGSELFAQKLWKRLPAVKADRLVPIADFPVFGYGDALAALDEIEAGLKKLQA